MHTRAHARARMHTHTSALMHAQIIHTQHRIFNALFHVQILPVTTSCVCKVFVQTAAWTEWTGLRRGILDRHEEDHYLLRTYGSLSYAEHCTHGHRESMAFHEMRD